MDPATRTAWELVTTAYKDLGGMFVLDDSEDRPYQWLHKKVKIEAADVNELRAWIAAWCLTAGRVHARERLQEHSALLGADGVLER